jgi:catechol 2,3-dioxygenase-like lactoylglutathione lyase family enzyme
MTSTQTGGDETAGPTVAVPFRLEVVVIPVADFDRAKDFYQGLGWRVDGELDLEGGYRLAQFTPPQSNASIIFGTQVTSAQPGSFDGLYLVVDDIDAARQELLSRGVEVSEVFHDTGGTVIGGFHVGDEGRAPGPDPEGRSYATYMSFNDSEGNRWVLQEITERAPGRV